MAPCQLPLCYTCLCDRCCSQFFTSIVSFPPHRTITGVVLTLLPILQRRKLSPEQWGHFFDVSETGR